MNEYLYRVDKNIIIGKHKSELVEILQNYLIFLMYPNLKKLLIYPESYAYLIWSF